MDAQHTKTIHFSPFLERKKIFKRIYLLQETTLLLVSRYTSALKNFKEI